MDNILQLRDHPPTVSDKLLTERVPTCRCFCYIGLRGWLCPSNPHSSYLPILTNKPEVIMSKPSKIAFVTVGATAPFNALVSACISSTVIAALCTQGYTDLRVQYGAGRSVFEQRLATTIGSRHSVSVSGFDFADSLREEIAAADLVISHAGMCLKAAGA